jgi:ABC-type Zn uptake system ZnuABC Zn-binding protein ZnuA
MHWRKFFLTSALVAALAACGSNGGGSGEAEGLRVVTTVSPITDIAATVIGDNATVVGVVPEGTNSHTFEPSPSVAEALAEADIVFINGLRLEEPTKQLALEVAPDGTELVELGDRTISPDDYKFDFSFPESEGKPNPHLWTDPSLALKYAEIVRDEMSALDPENAGEYAANYAAFATLVGDLDAAMRAAFATIPSENRKLVTYHDAYAYFAENYGFTVVGAVQPADFAEPTAGDIAQLISQIEAEGVVAVFGSEVFPSPILEQIENETGAVYVDDLRDDDLPGDPGDPTHSWLGLMKFNYATITTALGGDATSIESFDPGASRSSAAEFLE